MIIPYRILDELRIYEPQVLMDVPPQIEVLWRLLFDQATSTKANNGVHHNHQENGHGAHSDDADFVDVVTVLIIELPPPLLIGQYSVSGNTNNYPDPFDACSDNYARTRTRWQSLRGILLPSCSSVSAPLSPPHEQHQYSLPPHHGHPGSTGGADDIGFDPFAEPNSSSLHSVIHIALRELILATIEQVCVFYHT